MNLSLFTKKICSLSKFIFDEITTKKNQFYEIDVNHLKEIHILSQSFFF